MCLIVFAYHSHPNYPLIVVANRDEFYARPTQAAGHWPEHPGLFAGKDLQQGGTWMGLNSHSQRFAAVTNFRDMFEPTNPDDPFISRGNLVKDFLTGNDSAEHYCQALNQSRDSYQGYNLLLWEQEQLFYFSNKQESTDISPLEPGIYGLSNGLLDSPWPKVKQAKAALKEAIAAPQLFTEKLLTVLQSREVANDEHLPDTGIGLDGERTLSPCFIHMDGYGTRATTVLLVNSKQEVQFVEQNWDDQGEAEKQVSLSVK